MNKIAACVHDPLAVPQMALQCSVPASTSLPQMARLLQVLLMSTIEEEGNRIASQLEQGNKIAAPDAIEQKNALAHKTGRVC